MKITRFAAALVLLASFTLPLSAQEKPSPAGRASSPTLKVNVIISETEGDKKLSNLPYTFLVRAGEGSGAGAWTKVRVGSRVPVPTGTFHVASGDSKDGSALPVNTQYQYFDVGTNIDSRVVSSENGQFELALNLERSWVEGDTLMPGSTAAHQFKQPVIQQFKTELNLSMHDGQTVQSTQATDPTSGRLLSITVSVNVVK